jgi:hypothetical protein
MGKGLDRAAAAHKNNLAPRTQVALPLGDFQPRPVSRQSARRDCNRMPSRPFMERAHTPQRANEEKIMRQLQSEELTAVSGGGNKPASHPFPPGRHPSFRNPAHAPGNSYKGPARA